MIILDVDSSVSPTYGDQEGSAYNGHFGCTCSPPLFRFNQFGDLDRCALRPERAGIVTGSLTDLTSVSVSSAAPGCARHFAAFGRPVQTARGPGSPRGCHRPEKVMFRATIVVCLAHKLCYEHIDLEATRLRGGVLGPRGSFDWEWSQA